MIAEKITRTIGTLLILVPLLMFTPGYAADMTSAKEEGSAQSINSSDLNRNSKGKYGNNLFSPPAWVDTIKIVPSLSVREAYNDNVLLSRTDRKGDWVTTVSPALELQSKTERLDASISALFNGFYYIDQHDLNAIDSTYKGKMRYALTEKLALGADASFARDSQATREIDTTGVVFLTNVIRERKNFGVNSDLTITERIAASIYYNYGKDRYDQLNYSDQESHSAGLNFIGAITETLNGRLNFGFADYHVAGSEIIVDNYSGTIGLSKDFSKIWSFLIDAGTVYTRNQYNVMGLEITNNGWGPMGQVSVVCKYENTKGTLTLNRTVSPMSGTTGAANRTSLSLDINHKFTYELSSNIRASYFINKSDPGEFSNIGVDQNSLQLSIGPRYNFNKDMFLSLSYTYSKVNFELTKTHADQHLAMLAFNIQHTFFE